jgi:hypothetical protein
MALQAQLNDESFIHFATQKTKLGEKVINLSLRQCVIFFVFFVRGARHFFVRGAGIFLFVVQGSLSLADT